MKSSFSYPVLEAPTTPAGPYRDLRVAIRELSVARTRAEAQEAGPLRSEEESRPDGIESNS